MGAGDGFMGGLLAGLARGPDLPTAVKRGSATAALIVSGIGCAPASPTPPRLTPSATLGTPMHIAPFDNRNQPIIGIDNPTTPLCYFNIVHLKRRRDLHLHRPGL